MSTRPVILGELGLLSLFDLGQLLMLNGATGTLHVNSNGKKGFFRFERGQIANAVDEMLNEGEGAAYRLFAWRSGTFEFRVEPPLGPRTITDSTEGLMLEAARRMDEAGATENGESVTQALQARAGKFEALREVFQRVAFDASPVGRAMGQASDGTRFGMLGGPGDALLYRPGQPVRLQRDGHWQPAGDGALEAGAFAQLCSTFFDATASTGGNSAHRSVNEDGRVLEITRLPAPNEALLVRALEVVGMAPATLRGHEPAILEVLALSAGLVLVGAPGIRAAERLLHAALTRLLAERPLTSVLTAERGAWHMPESSGALIVTRREGFQDTLATFAPEVLVFDVTHADLSLEALHAAPIVVCAVVAPDAASVLPRWLARHGLSENAPNALPLAGAGIAVMFTEGGEHSGALPVIAAMTATTDRPATTKLRAVRGGGGEGDAAIGAVIERLRAELKDAA